MSELGGGSRPKGRGFPPDEYKWRPGQSGNPAGRPKGARNKVRISKALNGLTSSEATALEEGARRIRTADGAELATVAAIHRARNIGAIKGSRLMMKEALADVYRAERREEEIFEKALYIRELAERIHAHYKAKGITPEEFYVHPDDIEIDYSTKQVRIVGPVCATEKRHLDEAVACMKAVRRKVLQLRRAVEKDPLCEETNYFLLRHMTAYDNMNAILPERFKQPRLPLWSKARELPLPLSWRVRRKPPID